MILKSYEIYCDACDAVIAHCLIYSLKAAERSLVEDYAGVKAGKKHFCGRECYQRHKEELARERRNRRNFRKCECCKAVIKQDEQLFGDFCMACYKDITNDYYVIYKKCEIHNQWYKSNNRLCCDKEYR